MANCIWGVEGRMVICDAPKGLCVGEFFFFFFLCMFLYEGKVKDRYNFLIKS